MKVRYSYLSEQFKDIEPMLQALREFVPGGDFTLGKPVEMFEQRFAELVGTKYAVGVGSGTDALKLGLEAAGVKPGDEVITAANTFIATVGAINEIHAKPVLVDCDDSFCIDVDKIEAAITPSTRAIMPVYLTGNLPSMKRVTEIAQKHNLLVVEDACQAILGEVDGKRAGSWGTAAGFSMHPLKNLHVWGDAGVVVTNDAEVNRKLRLLRNHGMADRDHIELLGHNSRLDSLQAVIGNWVLPQAAPATKKRIENAAYYDAELASVKGIRIPERRANAKPVHHLYMVFAERRDELFRALVDREIECKIHYPIPLYQQRGLAHLGYKPGSFPVADRHAKEIITFPCDQYLRRDQADWIVECVRAFYAGK